jgi:signal transduction histidine kinase
LKFFDKIFHTFFQVDGSLSRGFERAGLGLSISNGLTELLGGKIWVEIEIGKGSKFWVSLTIK